jgi:hypothetical protein
MPGGHATRDITTLHPGPRPNSRTHSSETNDNKPSMARSKRPEVFRVCGIQPQATKARLIEALSALSENVEIRIEATMVPSCESTNGTNIGLVVFIPKAPEYLDPLYDGEDDVLVETEVGELTIDKNFHGLTQLYPTQPGEKIRAE